MWWNDSYQPEYLLNNHEAYIGETVGEATWAFLTNMAYVLLGGAYVAVFLYYYNMDFIPNFTFTKVGHQQYFNNASRMKEEKIGLEKDFMGSSKFSKILFSPPYPTHSP
jgi:hypothetical protein